MLGIDILETGFSSMLLGDALPGLITEYFPLVGVKVVKFVML